MTQDATTTIDWRGMFLVYADHKEDCPRRAMWNGSSWPPPECLCGFSEFVEKMATRW